LTGFNVDTYPDAAKIQKQFTYATKINCPYTLIIGDKEIEQQVFGLKALETGQQESLSIKEIIDKFHS
jgi:histidyl-tRNA synthetase